MQAAVSTLAWTPSGKKKGEGLWCEVDEPEDSWQALKKCPIGEAKTLVKVLTYNLFWWNLMDKRGGDHGRAGKNVAESSIFESYDFMGFQECKTAQRILDDAKSHGLIGTFVPIMENNSDPDVGMAYSADRWIELDRGDSNVGEDSKKQWYGKRRVVWGRFKHKVQGSTVFFINHHGPLPVSESGGCAGSATVYNIMKVINKNAQPTDAIILVGDFNAQPWSTRIQALSKYMNRIYTGDSFKGVDHIFSNCGKDFVVRKENIGPGGSDHDALNVVFKVP